MKPTQCNPANYCACSHQKQYSAATIRKWLEKAPEEFNTHHKETYAVLIAVKLEELK